MLCNNCYTKSLPKCYVIIATWVPNPCHYHQVLHIIVTTSNPCHLCQKIEEAASLKVKGSLYSCLMVASLPFRSRRPSIQLFKLKHYVEIWLVFRYCIDLFLLQYAVLMVASVVCQCGVSVFIFLERSEVI